MITDKPQDLRETLDRLLKQIQQAKASGNYALEFTAQGGTVLANSVIVTASHKPLVGG